MLFAVLVVLHRYRMMGTVYAVNAFKANV